MPFSDPSSILARFSLMEGMKVADFGPGSGAYALPLAKAVGRTGRVYAVEVQKELLVRLGREAAAQGFRNLELIWSDLERPGGSKLADRSVDFVLLANCLFQISGKYSLALEIKRVLKPPAPEEGYAGGRLAVIDWSDSFGHLGPPPGSVIKPETVKEIMANAGLKFLTEFPAGDHHYGLLFKVE